MGVPRKTKDRERTFMGGTKQYEEIPFIDDLFPVRILWNFRLGQDAVLREDSVVTWHEQLEILYILEGKIQIDCGYRRYICDKGDIVIVNPCEEHVVGYHSGNPSYHCIMIDPKFYAGGLLDRCGLQYMLPINGQQMKFNNLIRGNGKVSDILQELIAECEERRYAFEVAVKGNLLRLLAELFRSEMSGLQGDEKVIADKANYELVAPVFPYIAEHYAQKITLKDLAAACCVNVSHLCRVFKKLTGKTVMEYLNEYRLSKAQMLLVTTDLGLCEIAAQAGYTDMGYMMRRFKAAYGISPGRFRHLAGEGKEE